MEVEGFLYRSRTHEYCSIIQGSYVCWTFAKRTTKTFTEHYMTKGRNRDRNSRQATVICLLQHSLRSDLRSGCSWAHKKVNDPKTVERLKENRQFSVTSLCRDPPGSIKSVYIRLLYTEWLPAPLWPVEWCLFTSLNFNLWTFALVGFKRIPPLMQSEPFHPCMDVEEIGFLALGRFTSSRLEF